MSFLLHGDHSNTGIVSVVSAAIAVIVLLLQLPLLLLFDFSCNYDLSSPVIYFYVSLDGLADRNFNSGIR